jgi:hypothetical protein
MRPELVEGNRLQEGPGFDNLSPQMCPELAKGACFTTADARRPGDAYAWLWPIHGLVRCGVKRSGFETGLASGFRMGGLTGPHIPRLVCRQGPPDFESGLAT